MMTRRLLLVFILISLPMAGLAQDREKIVYLKGQIETFEKIVKELELWIQMQDAANYVPKKSRCFTYREMAEQTQDELKALKKKYVGRANKEYRRQSESLLDSNRRAIEEYRSCFGSVVGSRYDKVTAARVYRYQPFVARYNELNRKYGQGDVGPRWARLKDQIDRQKEQLKIEEAIASTSVEYGKGKSAGTVMSVFRKVVIHRKDKKIDAERGTQIFVGDVIRTGQRARIRIVLNDRCEKINAGPTVINIGSNSHFSLSKLEPYGDNCEKGLPSLGDLYHGTLRAFSAGWGSRAAFSVRVGTSLCGIRGTEVVVSYDPAWKEAEFWLDHGDAFMVTKSGKRSLKPGHVVRISNGKLSGERPFSRDEYASKVVATAESDNLSPEAAMASRASVTIKPNTSKPTTATITPGIVPPRNRLKSNRQSLAAAAAASEARRDMESLLAAYGRRDWNTVLRHLSLASRKKIRADLNKPGGESKILANANLPSKWRIDCLSCESGDKCDIYMLLSHTKKPNQYIYTHWSLQPDPGAASEDWMVVKSHKTSENDYKAGIRACPSR